MSDAQDTVTDQKVVTFTYVIPNGQDQIIEQPGIPMSYIHGVDSKMYPDAEKEL